MYYPSIHELGGKYANKTILCYKKKYSGLSSWGVFVIKHKHLAQTSTNFLLLVRYIARLPSIQQLPSC